MTRKLITQQDLLNKFIEQNEKMVEYLGSLKENLKSLNDENALHRQILQENTLAVKQFGTVNKSAMRIFMFLLILQAMAIIVLAGAEKVFEYVKINLPIQ